MKIGRVGEGEEEGGETTAWTGGDDCTCVDRGLATMVCDLRKEKETQQTVLLSRSSRLLVPPRTARLLNDLVTIFSAALLLLFPPSPLPPLFYISSDYHSSSSSSSSSSTGLVLPRPLAFALTQLHVELLSFSFSSSSPSHASTSLRRLLLPSPRLGLLLGGSDTGRPKLFSARILSPRLFTLHP